VLADNVYWESQVDDEIGPPGNDVQFATKLTQWGDMSALNSMPAAPVSITGTCEDVNDESRATIKLANNSNHVAFFLRVEVANHPGGNELLPIRYDDNYVTLFPHESRTLNAAFESTNHSAALRVEGYNVAKQNASSVMSCAR
jgi:exo-1,4-beta-D-glucosaminidase